MTITRVSKMTNATEPQPPEKQLSVDADCSSAVEDEGFPLFGPGELPPLTEAEKSVVDSIDMTPVMGRPEDRIRYLAGCVLRILREREEARGVAIGLLIRVKRGEQPSEMDCEILRERYPWVMPELVT